MVGVLIDVGSPKPSSMIKGSTSTRLARCIAWPSLQPPTGYSVHPISKLKVQLDHLFVAVLGIACRPGAFVCLVLGGFWVENPHINNSWPYGPYEVTFELPL